MKVREAIELAAHVAARSSSLPILAHVKFADGRVLSTDTMQQIDIPIELPASVAKLAFCVHGARLMKVLKALPEELEIGLQAKKSRLVITGGPTRYELNTMAPDDFPTLAESDAESTTVEVPSEDLVAALRFVAPAMAVNDIRFYLNGVHVSVEKARIVFTATNGALLHRASVAIDPHDSPALTGIVAGASVARIIEVAGRHERVEISLSRDRFGIEDAEVLLSKLVDGQYPDADRVIPTARPATAGVPRSAFIAAVKRMAAIGPIAVRLGFAEQAIALSAKNAEGEEAGEAFEWNASAAKLKPTEQAFAVDLLLQALDAFTGERINLHVGEKDNESLYITDDGDGSRQVVLMPYRA